MILGIDEVGRGVWAGPLVVGAVILGDARIDGLTDSKLLSKNRREKLAAEISQSAAAVGLGWVEPDEIDLLGLGPCLRLATQRAVKAVQSQHIPFDEIMIDGTINLLDDTPLGRFTSTLKKADLLIPSVSAAAIVAKVARDNYMAEQASIYPQYGFAEHVGYGTLAHRNAIVQHGVTPLHRLSIGPLQSYRDETVTASLATTQTSTRSIGDISESAAANELQRMGHTIVERNWKTKTCEIDIISRKGDTTYFCEVKHRRSSDSGGGLAAVTPTKLKQMNYAARLYVQVQKLKNANLMLLAIATTGDDPVVESVVEIR